MNIEAIIDEYRSAPYGSRTDKLRHYAALYGVSLATIWRRVKKAQGVKRKITPSYRIPEDWIDRAAAHMVRVQMHDAKGRRPRAVDVIAEMERRGEIPVGALSASTLNRRLRERGVDDVKPVSRWAEPFSNHTHYMDFSRSDVLGVKGYDGDRYILEVRGNSPIYKNKRGQKFGLWVGGGRDGRSGIFGAQYYTAAGESLFMGLDLLNFLWLRPADDLPLYSPPYHVRFDRGSFGKSAEAKSLFNALGVSYTPASGNKNAMAKIERKWRTLWQRFELKLLLRYERGYRMHLEDLNDLLYQHLLDEAEEEAPYDKGMTRRQKYEMDCLAYPRRIYDGDIGALATRPFRRKVGRDLSFSFDGDTYEAPARYMGKWVIVWRNINGDLAAYGEEDNVYFNMHKFQVRFSGDYRSFKETYRDQVIKRIEKEKPDKAAIPLTRKPEKIDVQSPHFTPESQTSAPMTINSARAYIAKRMNVESYNDVAHLFDDLIAVTTEKAAIDRIIGLAQTG